MVDQNQHSAGQRDRRPQCQHPQMRRQPLRQATGRMRQRTPSECRRCCCPCGMQRGFAASFPAIPAQRFSFCPMHPVAHLVTRLRFGDPFIMLPASIGIRQYVVSRSNELESLRRAGMSAMPVGMKLLTQNLVGRANDFGWSIARHLQIVVVGVQIFHEPIGCRNERSLIQNPEEHLSHLK